MTRETVTVALTTIAGPVGAVAMGAALARLADAMEGGMAGLAAGVGGLFIGGPILAFLVFGLCLAVLILPRPQNPLKALGIMAIACLVDGAVVMVGLAITARTGAGELAIIGVAVLSMVALALGAWLSLRVGGRTPQAPS